MQSASTNLKGPLLALGTIAAALCLLAGSARAATYPPGGGSFTNGAEGWHAVGETCSLPLALLCSSKGEYEGGAGNPPGSFAAKTEVIANLAGLLKATVNFESPNFTVAEGGSAQLHLDRELASTSALDLTPQATYTVTLLDRSGGGSAKVIEASTTGSATSFTGEGGSATVIAGHQYAISVATETSSSLANLGLLGSSALRFDNVSLKTVPSGSGGGGGGSGNDGGNGGSGGHGNNGGNGAGARGANGRNGSGAGGGAFSSSRLRSLFRSHASAVPLGVKGNRLFVKVSCPASIRRACHIVARGMLNRHTAATAKRTVKVGRARGKQIVLRIKPRAKKLVAKRKRLLVREAVRAGRVHATVFQSRKLIRRR